MKNVIKHVIESSTKHLQIHRLSVFTCHSLALSSLHCQYMRWVVNRCVLIPIHCCSHFVADLPDTQKMSHTGTAHVIKSTSTSTVRIFTLSQTLSDVEYSVSRQTSTDGLHWWRSVVSELLSTSSSAHCLLAIATCIHVASLGYSSPLLVDTSDNNWRPNRHVSTPLVRG